MNKDLRVLVIGCGNMGASHARAYRDLDGFTVAGVVSRGPESRVRLAAELGGVPAFGDYAAALEAVRPDVASINTYPDTHAPIARKALELGCHAFVEKPLAVSVEEARGLVELAARLDRKLVVGYILRVHPSWQRFIELARELGKPLVMRMNLNQQSSGRMWDVHRNLMQSMSPIVDCGVHYVDVMCQMTGARPVRVQAVGARLCDDLPAGQYNYGQLQVVFDDGSVGWYEAGWGPMMSEEAYFVKDVVGPRGSVSMVKSADAASDDVDGHTRTEILLRHHAELDAEQHFARPDERIDNRDEPGHQELCNREQAFLLRAIRENLDLADHLRDAVNSLRIVLAADESVRTGQTVKLDV